MTPANNANLSLFFDFNIYQFPENEYIIQKMKGLNNQKILIIFQSSTEEENDIIAYLKKILSAIKIQLEEDTFFLSIHEEEIFQISYLLNTKEIDKILLFGIQPFQLGLHLQIPLYTVIPFLKKKWLSTDSLLDIYKERDKTVRPKAAALWTSLNLLIKNN